jgi:hypothetical protein
VEPYLSVQVVESFGLALRLNSVRLARFECSILGTKRERGHPGYVVPESVPQSEFALFQETLLGRKFPRQYSESVRPQQASRRWRGSIERPPIIRQPLTSTTGNGKVICRDVLGGIVHEYERAA